MTKAAFVLNFSKFTEWPDAAFTAPDSALQLCLKNDVSEIGRALLMLDGRPVGARKVSVRHLNRNDSHEGCHILFVEQDALATFKAQVDGMSGYPLLTISDSKGFARHGGVIELVSSDTRLGFEVNLDAANHAGLRLSSQLLALARITKGP